MKEYLHDHISFFRQDMAERTGERFRPVDVANGTLIFDSRVEAQRRAVNRQRVEEWGRRMDSRPFRPIRIGR